MTTARLALRGARSSGANTLVGKAQRLAAGVEARGVALKGATALGVQDEGNDEPIETQHFSENENENHADEELRNEHWKLIKEPWVVAPCHERRSHRQCQSQNQQPNQKCRQTNRHRDQ